MVIAFSYEVTCMMIWNHRKAASFKRGLRRRQNMLACCQMSWMATSIQFGKSLSLIRL